MAYLLAAAALAAAAAVNPTLELARDRFRYVFVFDITHSMYVEDRELDGVATHRLALAKAAVRRSLAELPCGSEVSMAVFTEHRSFVLFTPVEVCRHLADLNTVLDSIDWRMAWAARSEVSKALFASLRTAPELGPHTRVVFLSDGHEAPPLHERFRPRYRPATTPAAGLVVGVGGDTPRPIPKPGTDGEVYTHAEVAQVDSYRLGRTSATVVEPLVGVDSSDVDARIAAGTEHLSRLRQTHLMALAGETALDYLSLEAPGDLTRALTRPDLAYRDRGPVALGWLLGLAALASAVLAHLPGIRSGQHR